MRAIQPHTAIPPDVALEILETQAYQGASFWADVPVVRMSLGIQGWEERPGNLLPDLCDHLASVLPGMREHRCSANGGRLNLSERAREDVSLSHLIEHVAVELQSLAGHAVDHAFEQLMTHVAPSPEGRG